MKVTFTRIFFLFLFFVSSFSSFSQSPVDLIISEYVEGSSNNKALEFYNGTGGAIDLTAGNYVIQMYFNGSATIGNTIALTGTVSPHGVFVLAQASASFASSAFVNQTNAGSWYNGDDAIVLRKGGASGTVVDVIGQVGFDPGTEWGTGLVSTADNTLRRKASICSGDTNPTAVFDPSVEWDGFATDTFNGLGTHTSNCSASGISIGVNPAALSFSAPVGTPSAEQSYSVSSTGLTEDITINIPSLSGFGLSLVSGGPYSGTVTIPVAQANAAGVTVFVIFNPSSSGSQGGAITNVSGSASASVNVQGTATGTGATTHIYDIQGPGAASPLVNAVVTTEGIVTADFQGTGQLSGFYIQDTTGDGNVLTSDGVFVFNTSFPVKVGDYVRVTGQVTEYFNKTEINNVTAVATLSTGNTVIAPVDIQLPVAAVADLERYEGMLVRFPQTLSVSETFTLGRYGEVLLSVNGVLETATNFVDPNDNPATGNTSSGASNLAAVNAQQDLNNRSQILLDDASSVENPPIVPYLSTTDTTLRIGSTLTTLTGILDYDFSVYRLQPTVNPAFAYAPRPAVPAVGPGNIKVSSFNVLNYFNGDGIGGGFPTPRGANTLAEFQRQRIKIIAAIKSLDADVTGLTEIENDGDGSTSAIADLVNGLNAATAPGTFAYVSDPTGFNGNSGTDAIKVAMIYKPSKVILQGVPFADTNFINNRPPLAQTFKVVATGEVFSVIINHLKSKGCTGASGANADQLDGQSCFNATRKQQAQALLAFIGNVQSRSGDSDVISVGDYNAYEQEDPIDILRAGGLIDLTTGLFSYVFDGQSGALDYAFATPSLSARVTGVNKWHINSDEPVVKDYNQEFNPPYVYSPDAFRSSDHDPVLVGLRLGDTPPAVAITSPVNDSIYPAGHAIALNATATSGTGSITRVEFYNNGLIFLTDSTAPYGTINTDAEPGNYVLTAKAYDDQGLVSVSDTVRVTIAGCTPSGSISGYGYTNIAGTQVSDLTSNPAYPDSVSISATLSAFEYSNIGDNYGGRLRGYICAPQSGNYTFYIASDEQAGLYLSTDENPDNKVLIAYNLTPTGFHNWTRFASQRSATIHLVKGARYYVETLHKEGTGADYLSVGWILPSGVQQSPIPGSVLSPYNSPSNSAVSRDFATSMAARMSSDNGSVGGLKVIATPNPSYADFTLTTRSSSLTLLAVRVTDLMGRVVEQRVEVPANGTFQLGSKFPAGIYFVEVRQDDHTEKIKLIKL